MKLEDLGEALKDTKSALDELSSYIGMSHDQQRKANSLRVRTKKTADYWKEHDAVKFFKWRMTSTCYKNEPLLTSGYATRTSVRGMMY